MTIIIQGLGRMGMQIARKLAEADHKVIVVNRSQDKVETAETYGAHGANSKQTALEMVGDERAVVWIMLPADIVDDQAAEWLEILPEGSIIIDGGNSDFRRTKKLNELVQDKGCELVDIGVSGGVWGYQNGFPLMCGSDSIEAFEAVEPALKTLSQPGGAYYRYGSSGSGHFVKMVHNAIEYGMMESLAEGYQMLKVGPYAGEIDLAEAGEVWQHHSVITSWLNELSRDALRENPELDGIDGYVAESGEARWTLEAAKDQNVELPAIQAAFDVRLNSQKGQTSFATKLLAAMRNKFGGHELNK